MQLIGETMKNGILHLRAATRLLEDQAHLRRERVAQAANEFWNAMFHSVQIPSNMLESAEQIQILIASKGTVNRTLSTLTDAEVWHIANLIRDFTQKAEESLK